MESPTRTHRRRSGDEWKRLIAEQQQSGLSQQAFCRDKGLALSTFCNRKRRLAGTKPASHSAPSDWLELPVGLAPSAGANWDIELDLGDGVCLRLGKR